jgi:RNA polymerase sigma factor (sigma-70 family)
MDEQFLAGRFEAHRTHLRGVAYRMLGSLSEAEDAVQEAWLRLSRSDSSDVQNMRAWLTTIVARVCLNMLQSRRSRREEPISDRVPDPTASREDGGDPEREAVLAESVGLALLVVLDTLTPAERLAFVLHDMFAVPFEEIAPIVERSPATARQLASRARRRVHGVSPVPDADGLRQRQIVGAFLAASRGGDFEALLALLDPDVVLRADVAAVKVHGTRRDQVKHPGLVPRTVTDVRGAAAVAETFSGRARAARPALIDGAAGAVWALGGQPRIVFNFTIEDGRIVAIDMVADPTHIGQFDVEILND